MKIETSALKLMLNGTTPTTEAPPETPAPEPAPKPCPVPAPDGCPACGMG